MSAIPAAIAELVDVRDAYRCVRCGASLAVVTGSRHHRLRRREGGHSVANIVLLCGSGTTGCHGWVHDHPTLARAEGLIVPANGRAVPQVIPLHAMGPWGHREWVLLDDEGGRAAILPQVAMETLEVFGLLREGAA